MLPWLVWGPHSGLSQHLNFPNWEPSFPCHLNCAGCTWATQHHRNSQVLSRLLQILTHLSKSHSFFIICGEERVNHLYIPGLLPGVKDAQLPTLLLCAELASTSRVVQQCSYPIKPFPHLVCHCYCLRQGQGLKLTFFLR